MALGRTEVTDQGYGPRQYVPRMKQACKAVALPGRFSKNCVSVEMNVISQEPLSPRSDQGIIMMEIQKQPVQYCGVVCRYCPDKRRRWEFSYACRISFDTTLKYLEHQRPSGGGQIMPAPPPLIYFFRGVRLPRLGVLELHFSSRAHLALALAHGVSMSIQLVAVAASSPLMMLMDDPTSGLGIRWLMRCFKTECSSYVLPSSFSHMKG